jgi:hypothetical protein
MVDNPHGNIGPRRHRAVLAVALLVVMHVAFRALLNPIGVSVGTIPEWVGLLCMGILVSQPVLFGIWAAIGPGAYIARVPATFAALIAVCIAGVIRRWNLLLPSVAATSIQADQFVWDLALFALVMGTMWIVGRFVGWRVVSYSNEPPAAQPNQFSLKFLVGLTAVCSVLLAIGRLWASANASAASFAGIVLLTLFPVLVLPFIVLSERPLLRLILLVPVLWALLTWLAIETVAAMEKVPPSQVANELVLLQVGAAIASLTAAMMLRLAGYRFSRPPRRSRPS